jgi:Skp family chaperone for outer membrane proteins
MKTSKYTGWCLSFVMLAGLLAGGVCVAEAPKLATVDMQKLFKEYHRTVDAQSRYNAEYADIQKRINERKEPIERIRNMLKILADEIKKGELSVDQLEAKKREGQILSQELKMMEQRVSEFSANEQQRVAKLKASSMQGIMNEIKQKVSSHAKKHGFDFVFDKSGKNTNQVSFFIYLRDAEDITAHMLKELNKFAPGAAGD